MFAAVLVKLLDLIEAWTAGFLTAVFVLAALCLLYPPKDAARYLVAVVVTTTDRCARMQAVHRLDYYGDREGWALLILDALDRRQNPEAQLLHGIRVSVAAYERALIARRTRAALAYRKSIGVRIGRPRRCPDDVLTRVLTRVLELRAGGARLVDVAAAMNVARVPTPGGGARWWPSHVSRLLATQDARALAACRIVPTTQDA